VHAIFLPHEPISDYSLNSPKISTLEIRPRPRFFVSR